MRPRANRRQLHPAFVVVVRDAWQRRLQRESTRLANLAGAITWDTENGHGCFMDKSDEKRLARLAGKLNYVGPLFVTDTEGSR